MTLWSFGMEFYTIALSKWRKAKSIDVPILDITVKSGEKAFAPTWDLLSAYKDGVVSDEEYTNTYYELMRKSFVNNRSKWIELLESDVVAIACYCKAGKFCHRILLKDMILKVAKSLKYDVEYLGELE